MEILSETKPKANKDHICMWCGGVIKKGETYYKTTIKNEGLYTWKNHSKCSRLYDELNMYDNNDDGTDMDSFMENVYEFIYKRISEDEYDGLFGESAVNKAIEILDKLKEV